VSSERARLEVRERETEELGSRSTRRLRAQGLIPGVLYGKGHARAFVVGERDLRAVLSGPSGLHAIVDVILEGQTTPHHAVLKEYQVHPVRGTLTHIDFHEVRLDRPIQATVAIHLVGEAPGSRAGGVVQLVARELRVESLPMSIPESVDVSIDELELNGSIRLEELPAIEDVAFLDDPTLVIATCTTPTELSVEDETTEVEGEEVEGEAVDADGDAESSSESGDSSSSGE